MIEIKNLTKKFIGAGGEFTALENVSLCIPDGEIYGIIGMSGAGKSTLVRCINMLEKPTEGSVTIDGVDLGVLKESELRKMRRNITMIFQGFNLLMQKNCLKNVCFPMELEGMSKAEAKKKAKELLTTVGLQDKLKSYPSQLSGGQQQRVAIARALATNPKVLLCDEATSALDPQTTHSILSLLKDINKKLGITIIVITHQMSVVEEICTSVAILDKGVVAESGKVSDVFSSPKSDAAKNLVYPDGYNDTAEYFKEQARLRVVFNGAEAAGTPLIAKMAIEINIQANIIGASTKTIGGKAYGNMLLGISGGEQNVARAIEYLRQIPDIIAEEVKNNV